jgi:hypothetical protein
MDAAVAAEVDLDSPVGFDTPFSSLLDDDAMAALWYPSKLCMCEYNMTPDRSSYNVFLGRKAVMPVARFAVYLVCGFCVFSFLFYFIPHSVR